MASTARRFAWVNGKTLADLARALFELGIARLQVDSRKARALIAAPPGQVVPVNPGQAALVARVAFAIPRVAVRLPWRADCLVQALAANRWLDRKGIASTLTLGVLRDMPQDFEAHAWLTAGNRVVTGGDIGGYVSFTRS